MIEHEVDHEDQVSVFSFLIDHWTDEIEVTCRRWEQTNTECTSADLLARSKHLAAWYAASLERYADLEQQRDALANLIDDLNKDVAQQQDRLYKKLQFFDQVNPVKAEAIKACIKLYERLAFMLEDRQTGGIR